MSAGGRFIGVSIEVDTIRLGRIREGLRIFAPKLGVGLDAELRRDVEPVTKEAESRLRARAEETSTGSHYGISRRHGGVTLYSRTRGSAIAEFAGSVHPQGLTPRGATLIATLNERYGAPGRLLWEAWDSRSEAVTLGVRQTVESFEAQLQKVIDGGAGA